MAKGFRSVRKAERKAVNKGLEIEWPKGSVKTRIRMFRKESERAKITPTPIATPAGQIEGTLEAECRNPNKIIYSTIHKIEIQRHSA